MIPILYEDNEMFIVNKPAGMPATRQKNGQLSIADMMTEQFPALSRIGSEQDAGLVHRLDNDTSGCLIIAKTPETYTALRHQFDANTIYKEYQALVVGHPATTGHSDDAIVHDPKSTKRMRCAHSSEMGQAAHTEWTVLHYYPISTEGPAGYAHLQIRITTGVRHQIRVHMAHLGYPLVGDRVYQSRIHRGHDKLGLLHHLLHASCVACTSPSSETEIRCVAPPSPPFSQTLKTLDEIEKRR
jgi:23S rRNA pseudouridine1911/1915/1917 synthase